MKKLLTIVVIVALGAATTACNDQGFEEVEQSIEQGKTFTTDDDEQEEDKPGGN